MNPTLSDIQNLRIADFDYPLPDERIARYPLADRDRCKLLVFNGKDISHQHFSDLPGLLKPDTLLVMNNTRVINARMEFHKESGARIEIFLLEPLSPRDYAQAFQQRERCVWQCMVGNLKKWKDGSLRKQLTIGGKEVTVSARRGEPLPGNAHAVTFEWDDASVTFASIVEAGGNIPIPPYLNRDTETSDSTDYQTVYSRISGSVAAPTAGLHFTPELLQALRDRGVDTREVTLHVGAGTFQPVKSEEIGGHPMHTEVFGIDLDLVRSLRKALAGGHPVVAVGTTTVRTLESLPILGMKVMQGDESMKIGQWEAYSAEALSLDTDKALAALESFMEHSGLQSMQASTAIMIAPGFRWRIAGGLITNFHQPRSTLLLLVSSFLGGGKDWERVYEEALRADYRFLSYGDACFFHH
ncbi:MAG: S-adenosylmethionine:tRNA ribosyltransferase-isomerase [Muribaculaceae bacterium]|nr:S-adenosylmethionine:tRNA ribosyltransferase-isomerase [Muribaculaceae bacterium]